jgi:hypothetical protein
MNRDIEKDLMPINPLFGRRAAIGPIPAAQFPVWMAIGGASFFLFKMLLALSYPAWLLLWVWLSGSYWVLTGDRDYQFFKRWGMPPGEDWINNNSLFVPVTDPRWQMRSKTQPKVIKATTRQGMKRFMSFQSVSHIHSIVDIQMGQHQFACLLLYDPLFRQWSAQIPFTFQGFHPQLYRNEVETLLDNIQQCMSEIPTGESLTFHLSCRSNAKGRSQELEDLAQDCGVPAISVLLWNEQQRMQELTERGVRQAWEQTIWVTWTAQKNSSERTDPIGQGVQWFQERIQGFSRSLVGTEQLYFQDFYLKTARQIFEYGYLPWRNLLETKADLTIAAMKPEEVWEWLWYRFNRHPYGEMPEVIRIEDTEKGTEQTIPLAGSKDLVSRLIQGEKGQTACPKHRQEKRYLYCNGKVGKVVVLEEAPKHWRSGRSALKWVWEHLSSPYLKDIDMVVQITTRERWVVQDEMEKLNRQSLWERKRAIEEGTGKKVYADIKDHYTSDALVRIAEGTLPLYCAPVLVLWRDSERACEEAASHLCQSFETVQAVVENDIAWRVWCETLPINNFLMLKSYAAFSERRITMDSTTVVGFLPLTCPLPLDETGMELITESGGRPVYVDLFTEPERLIVTGATGSGKSVLGGRIIMEAIAQHIPVVGMDLSTGGNSTYQLLVQMLGEEDGAYINILQETLNLLEPPDLRNLPQALQKPRFLRWKDFVRQILVAIAMDQIIDPALQVRVNAIVLRLLEVFLRDAEMIERYNHAFMGGWKSSEWQQMPTVRDLLNFCSKEKMNLESYGELDAQAINQIYSQLEAKLMDPNVGNLLGKPSSVNPKPKMTFYALSGLTNENNSYIIALCAQMACLRTALEHPKSLFVGDELSVLLSKRGFAEIIGEQFAAGRKEGISMLILLQDLDAIINCSASAQILANRGITITGLTRHGSTHAYIDHLGFPEEIINLNATDKYKQNRGEMFSRWLVERNGRFWDTRFYAPPMLLAALANNDEEKLARERMMARYPQTQRGYLEGLKHFTDEYQAALLGTQSMKQIGLTDYQKHQLSRHRA